MNIYEFKALIWDDKELSYQGYVTAPSYSQAVIQLVGFLGEEELIQFQVKYVSDSPVLIVPENIALNAITGENI